MSNALPELRPVPYFLVFIFDNAIAEIYIIIVTQCVQQVRDESTRVFTHVRFGKKK